MAKIFIKKHLKKNSFMFLHPDPVKHKAAEGFLKGLGIMRKVFAPHELLSILGLKVPKTKKAAKDAVGSLIVTVGVQKIEDEGWGISARAIRRGETKKINKFEKSVVAWLKSAAKEAQAAQTTEVKKDV